MTYEQANTAWDNGEITLDQLKVVALATLTGEELADALDDIASLADICDWVDNHANA